MFGFQISGILVIVGYVPGILCSSYCTCIVCTFPPSRRFFDVSPCQSHSGAIIAFCDIIILVDRGTVVCLQVHLTFRSVVERTPQQFICHLLTIFCHSLCDAKVNGEVVYMPYDDVLLVDIRICVELLQHGADGITNVSKISIFFQRLIVI